MVMLSAPVQGRLLELRDASGRSLGQVLEPKVSNPVGRGEGTVLLIRRWR